MAAVTWGDKHIYLVYDWGRNTLVGRFANLADARAHCKRYAQTYDSWRVYRELNSLRRKIKQK